MTEARWMNRHDTADYLGMPVDHLKRHVKSGKIPEPTYHFGPNSPRWDRLALDAAIEGSNRSPGQKSVEETVSDILSGKYSRRQAGAGGRVGQDVSVRAPEEKRAKAG